MKNQEQERNSFLDRVSWFLTRRRKAVFFTILALTAVALIGSFRIKGEVILQDMLPYDHPYLKLQARFSEVFGSGGSTVAIGIVKKKGDIFNQTTLAKIKKMTEEVELLDEVYRLLTVSIASSQTKVTTTRARGEIAIEPLMFPDIPKNDQEMAELKKNVFSDPAYSGILVSEDGSAALLLTEFKENISYFQVYKILQKIVKDYTDEDSSVHIVGYPMLMGWVYSLKVQMYMVFAISIGAIALVLWMVFLNIPGMISPLVNAGILTIWGLGFIGFTGVNFSPLLYVLAFLVGSRLIGNSNQIAYRYFEELNASGAIGTKVLRDHAHHVYPNFAAVAAMCRFPRALRCEDCPDANLALS
jgi:predicted RND superfamily exporter protein